MAKPPKSFATVTPQAFQQELVIDRDDLESALLQQAPTLYTIGTHHVNAIALRDAMKQRIEEMHAELDGVIRKEAAETETKITEATIANQIKNDPDMQEIQAKFLVARREVDEWGVLKDAFIQRSYMLRELVQLKLREMMLEGMVSDSENSANALRNKQGEETARKAGEMRRAKLGKK